MGKMISLTASDGHVLNAYEAGMPDASRALVVVQEIFGVNHHVRAVCDGFGDAGFHVIAPALFDRAAPGTELAYDGDGMKAGSALVQRISQDGVRRDVRAAAEALNGAKIGIIGYCWGGTVAWEAATTTNLFGAAVGWYGGGIARSKDAEANCPVQLHFGAEDDHIPLSDIEAIRQAQPGVEVFVYDGAGHGFGCDERGSYEAKSAALAQERTLAFLAHNL